MLWPPTPLRQLCPGWPRAGADERQGDVTVQRKEQVKRRGMAGLQDRPQPVFGVNLHIADAFTVPADGGQLGQHRVKYRDVVYEVVV